jgi:hypothetical protein
MEAFHLRCDGAAFRGVGDARGGGAKGLGETETIPGLLLYRPPAGWNIVETGGDSQALGPISNGIVPSITMSPGNHGLLAKLSDTFEPEYYDTSASLKIVSQKSFTTSAGVKGVCAQCVDPSGQLPIVQYSYVFLSPDGQELELACACASVDAKVYKPVFDASMKTVVILNPE